MRFERSSASDAVRSTAPSMPRVLSAAYVRLRKRHANDESVLRCVALFELARFGRLLNDLGANMMLGPHLTFAITNILRISLLR